MKLYCSCYPQFHQTSSGKKKKQKFKWLSLSYGDPFGDQLPGSRLIYHTYCTLKVLCTGGLGGKNVYVQYFLCTTIKSERRYDLKCALKVIITDMNNGKNYRDKTDIKCHFSSNCIQSKLCQQKWYTVKYIPYCTIFKILHIVIYIVAIIIQTIWGHCLRTTVTSSNV